MTNRRLHHFCSVFWIAAITLPGCIVVPTWERPDPQCGEIVAGGGTLPAHTDLRFLVAKFSELRIDQSTRHDVETALGKAEETDLEHHVSVYGQMMSQNYQANFFTWGFGPTRCRTCYLLLQFDEANVLRRGELQYDNWHEGVSDWVMREAYPVPDGMIEAFVSPQRSAP